MKKAIQFALLFVIIAVVPAAAQRNKYKPPGCACPDLEPVLFGGEGSSLKTRIDDNFLYFSVKNVGNTDAPASIATFTYYLSDNKKQTISVPTPAVAAGRTIELKVSPKTCSSPTTGIHGGCRYDVELDVRDTVKESDENNNFAEGTIEG
jgi:hypothetical protein